MDKEAMKLHKRYKSIEGHLRNILNIDPEKAIEEAKNIHPENSSFNEEFNIKQIKAIIFVDGGILLGREEIIRNGMAIFEWCYEKRPTATQAYDIANSLAGMIGSPPHDGTWLDYQERTREERFKIRQYFWKVVNDKKADYSLRSLALTNIGNQFSTSYRYGDAHDAWFRALRVDPQNGVAAAYAAYNLEKFYFLGIGTDDTFEQIKILAEVVRKNSSRLTYYTNKKNADKILNFANRWGEPSKEHHSRDPFIRWVKDERLALSATFGVSGSKIEDLDSLCLPSIKFSLEEEQPPIFPMFNMLKSDFILARYLTWRAFSTDNWSDIKGFASTFDGAIYGSDISALILVHRFLVDLLDKIAVAANNYFNLGERIESISFGKLWRDNNKKIKSKNKSDRPLKEKVNNLIRSGVRALYGLVELSGDYYTNEGILNLHKEIRNASTHRFVILHEYMGAENDRSSKEIKRYEYENFQKEVIQALRIVRSAIQVFVLAIRQHEYLKKQECDTPALMINIPDFER